MTFLTECKSEYIVALFSDQTTFLPFLHTRKNTTTIRTCFAAKLTCKRFGS